MKQSLLWKLSKENHKDSYILGTMHVKSKGVFSRLPDIEKAILNSTLFAAEYNLDEIQFVQQPADLLIPDGASLTKLLGKKKMDRVQKSIFKSFKLDITSFEYYLPLLLVNVIGEAILTKDFREPLDIHLWKFAKSNDLKLDGMETYDSQQVIMKSILLKDQIKMLKDISKKPYGYRKNILKMASWYEQGEINLLYKHGKKSLGKYKNILLFRRNYIMAARFNELSKNDNTFVAIGAGHLAGKKGVLKILKENGWKLKAI